MDFVVKLKKNENDSLGFSLLKAADISHVIYEINDNIVYESPASKQVNSEVCKTRKFFFH
jgi:hypothetical protein